MALLAALVALGSLVVGCSLGRRLGLVEGDGGLHFSHALHAGEQELECGLCHAFDGEEYAVLPTLAQCLLCHEDLDAEKEPERRVETLFDGELYRAGHHSALSDEILFSHPDHALDESLCGTCHAGIEGNERLDAGVAVRMDACSRCHANLGIANECATCHAEIREDSLPRTHHGGWTKAHGTLFRTGSRASVNRCDLCHTERDCSTCHFSVPPDNHTNHWRRRGHGITARMDRQNCAACHRSDSCEACHQEVRPVSHRGMFAGAQNRHCLSCHVSDQEGGCFVCHDRGRPHPLGAAQPPDHAPGMNCLQCHGTIAPLPHVTQGEDCTICHP